MYILTFSIVNQVLQGPILEIIRPKLASTSINSGLSIIRQLSLLYFVVSLVLMILASISQNIFTFISNESDISFTYLLPYLTYFFLMSLSGLGSALLNGNGKYIIADLLLSLLIFCQLAAVVLFHNQYKIDLILIWGINIGIALSLLITLAVIKGESKRSMCLPLKSEVTPLSLSSIFKGIFPIYAIFLLVQFGLVLEKRFLVGLGSGMFLLFHYPSQIKNILSGFYQSLAQSIFITERSSNGKLANVPLYVFATLQFVAISVGAVFLPNLLVDYFTLSETLADVDVVFLFRLFILSLLPITIYILLSSELLVLNLLKQYKAGGLLNSIAIVLLFLLFQGDYIYTVPLVLIASHTFASFYMAFVLIQLRKCY